MAQNPTPSDGREEQPRADRPAPPRPLSPRKAAAARRRELTDAILRARAS